MEQKYNVNLNLNTFLKNIKLKKNYIISLKNKNLSLQKIRETNYKYCTSYLFQGYKYLLEINNCLVTYVIDITFSKSNTFVHVMDFYGKLIFFDSAGSFNHKGKAKQARFAVFKNIYKKLILELKFLKNKPIALHLKNVNNTVSWIVKKLKMKFYIKCVKIFNSYPHNGCRKIKVRRKKL